jgi:oxygen-independent coproporphyrinogen-3 oxidase
LESLESGGISLYVHIPFCEKKCGYCDFYSLVPLSSPIVENFLTQLRFHINYAQMLFDSHHVKVNTLYFGGGTPSLISPRQWDHLLNCIQSSFTFHSAVSPLQQISIEANPESLTREHLDVWQDRGVGRISLGLQSMNNRCLTSLDRLASRESNLKALKLISSHWRGTWSADLLSSIPGRCWREEEKDLIELLGFNPPHVSYYHLILEEGTPFFEKHKEEELPSENWQRGKDLLLKEGYRWEEVSNFALPGYEGLHNQAYWELKSYLGLGPGAHSTLLYNHEKSPNLIGKRWEAQKI